MHRQQTAWLTALGLLALSAPLYLSGCASGGSNNPSVEETEEELGSNDILEEAVDSTLAEKLSVLETRKVEAAPSRSALPNTSPNGFKRPQCTWGSDWLCYSNGWKLRFSRNYSRNARLWVSSSLLTNAVKTTLPRVGGLFVINSSSAGHVAVVVDVYTDPPSGGIILDVAHSNWPSGSDITRQYFVLSADRRTTRAAYYNRASGKWVFGRRCAVLGFLAPA